MGSSVRSRRSAEANEPDRRLAGGRRRGRRVARAPRTAERGLFGPSSVTWKVNREAVLLLGGGRALLMQIAHPLVAAAVAKHSNFKEDPIGRLRRTLELMYAITFGSRETAHAAWRAVDRVHANVRGRLSQSAGDVVIGTRYRARDPELLFWVHATLIDTTRVVYERYVRHLPRGDWEHYYRESKIAARLFGVPERLVPPDLGSFDLYVQRTVETLHVTDAARDLAQAILHPPVPLIPAAVFGFPNLVTVGLLPDPIRRGFGLTWGSGPQLLLDATAIAVRRLLPWLPDILRASAAARSAERKVGTLVH